MSYRINSAAQTELFDAITYYESARDGLGAEFLDEIERGIGKVLETPMRWPEIAAGIRRYRLSRFPYGLLYRSVDSVIEIVAVMDLRRKPRYWKDRLKG